MPVVRYGDPGEAGRYGPRTQTGSIRTGRTWRDGPKSRSHTTPFRVDLVENAIRLIVSSQARACAREAVGVKKQT